VQLKNNNMQVRKLTLEWEEYNSIDDLGNPDDITLLNEAKKATQFAFAGFSNFKVGAAARVRGEKEIYIGSNQENASYPVGICAERSVLAAVASKFGSRKIIDAIAISYENANEGRKSDEPITPCGMCRQALVQYEVNAGQPIRLILAGKEGKVYVIKEARQLLPLGFDGSAL
jgi:cytidine deaminase